MTARPRARRVLAQALGAFAFAFVALPAAVASAATTVTFQYTGAVQTWTVPAGITSATFDLYGAAGSNNGPTSGGLGGRATATLSVAPGQVVSIYVGGAGTHPNNPSGGFNGGGRAGAVMGGGGGTDLRIGGTGLTDRVLVAGGGGGVGVIGFCPATAEGGAGGGLDGLAGAPGDCGVPNTPGAGGSQTAGGAGGDSNSDGSLGQGGAYGDSGTIHGGGGGGYYGGGGGNGSAGGGGGSGYGPVGTDFETGVRSGHGLATVTYATQTLTVTKAGTGQGGVTSSPAGIDCGADCTEEFIGGQVTLTASAATGSDFSSWGGACASATGSTCTVTMDQSRNVTATFTAQKRTLSVTRAGNGAGAITSDPGGITCSPSCSADFDYGTSVELTATAAAGTDFSGWGGACASATGSICTVTMDQVRSVTVTFTLQKRNLSVAAPSGSGTGQVTSQPSGIVCPSGACSADFDYGTQVTLTAAPATGSDFSGWGGACASATGSTCTVTMNQARSVTAAFTLQKRTLTATKEGTGQGSLVSDPAGIDCGDTCSSDYDYGAQVALSADPATGSDFTGWDGACASATGDICTVTMDQARDVTATFTLQKRTLTVVKDGTGQGSVASDVTGVDCGAVCSAELDYGTEVTLTATPSTGSTFTGWNGSGCSGTSSCTVTMDEARSATATFNADPIPPDDAPEITDLEVSPNRFRIVPRSTDPGYLKVPKGTKIKLTLSESARVVFRIKNAKPSGNGDSPPPPKTRPRAFVRNLAEGPSAVAFTGKLLKRTFEPGRYRLVAWARDSAGQRSPKVAARFRVVP